MTSPFVMALQTDRDKFLGELETEELHAVAEACIGLLEARAKEGDQGAPNKLQVLYRQVANVEI
jgi:hypothetical protein